MNRNKNQRQSEKCHPGAPRKSAAGTETPLSNPGRVVFGGARTETKRKMTPLFDAPTHPIV